MKPRSPAAARKAERWFEVLRGMAASSSTNPPANLRRALGLMSGTSLDGIDVAALATDGERHVVAGPALTVPYPDAFRERLRSVLGGDAPAAATTEIEAEFRRHHSDVAIDLVGFHGHTLLHRPKERQTWQLGDGALLARLAGVAVVGD